MIDTDQRREVAGTGFPIQAGHSGVAVARDGKHVYVTDSLSHDVSVIDTVSNTVVATVPVDSFAVAITPDGKHAHVSECGPGRGRVSVIDTATHAVVATVAAGDCPNGAAVTLDGAHAYVTNGGTSWNVSVIDTATNKVVATIPVGGFAYGVAITPDGKHAYVTGRKDHDGRVFVIDTATNAVGPRSRGMLAIAG